MKKNNLKFEDLREGDMFLHISGDLRVFNGSTLSLEYAELTSETIKEFKNLGWL